MPPEIPECHHAVCNSTEANISEEEIEFSMRCMVQRGLVEEVSPGSYRLTDLGRRQVEQMIGLEATDA